MMEPLRFAWYWEWEGWLDWDCLELVDGRFSIESEWSKFSFDLFDRMCDRLLWVKLDKEVDEDDLVLVLVFVLVLESSDDIGCWWLSWPEYFLYSLGLLLCEELSLLELDEG